MRLDSLMFPPSAYIGGCFSLLRHFKINDGQNPERGNRKFGDIVEILDVRQLGALRRGISCKVRGPVTSPQANSNFLLLLTAATLPPAVPDIIQEE